MSTPRSTWTRVLAIRGTWPPSDRRQIPKPGRPRLQRNDPTDAKGSMMRTRTTPGEVVVGVDSSVSGRAALQWAATYARSTGARLRAIHVLSPDSLAPMAWSQSAFPTVTYSARADTRESDRSEIQAGFDALPPESDWGLEFCQG